MLEFAIHPDRIVHKNGEVQSFSKRWIEVASHHGVKTRLVNAYSQAFLNEIRDYDAFMWRFGYSALPRVFAKRLLIAIEHGLRIPVFPSWQSMWHFEDKVAQHYLLQAARIPEPETWVFWNSAHAEEFCSSAKYPLVFKLSYGFRSSSVRMLRDRSEAQVAIDSMFGRHTGKREIHGGYLYLQEFLPDNAFDTRVTVIGRRAFAFRRFNRPNDFRASGSGLIDWNAEKIDEATIRLAFDAANKLDTQSIAIDGLRKGNQRVVGEISYTYASWAVRDCPGHWKLSGDPQSGALAWVQGSMEPADAILEEFVTQVTSSRGTQSQRFR
jgi:glutathione synthase/RimK-type ligase-like ATP-grasp enzyme